ncbi:MAG: CBS domain-containing protein [Firmicutes bacterium]|nr:CBS domain-containing protein [Bacillota bacterium]
MRVRDRMTSKVFTTTLDTSIGDAWKVMKDNDLRRLPVTDRGILVGIVTKKDFDAKPDISLRDFPPSLQWMAVEQNQLLSRIKIREVIPEGQTLITIHQDAYVEQAAKLLRDNRISGLPVVDDKGRLVGIITSSDVLDAYQELLAINKNGVRVRLQVKETTEALGVVSEVLKANQNRLMHIVALEGQEGQDYLVLLLDKADTKKLTSDFNRNGIKVESIVVKK